MKAAETLIFELIGDIARQRLSAGSHLPSLEQLLATYGVSRSTLREALSFLSMAGLVSLHRGHSTGNMVGQASGEKLASVAAPFFCLAGATYRQILDAWLATEPLLAEQAATNPDREFVRQALEAHIPTEASQPVHPTFHDAVAKASGNPVMALIVQSITHTVANLYWAMAQEGVAGETLCCEHGEVLGAILDGDGPRARRAMEAHLRHMIEEIERRMPASLHWRFGMEGPSMNFLAGARPRARGPSAAFSGPRAVGD